MAIPLNIVNPGHSFPALADAAISQYDCVIGASEGEVKKSDGVNKRGIGFVHEGSATTALQHLDVFVSGVVWARAAAAITIFDELETAADGEVQTAGVGDFIVGIALGAAAGANEKIPVLIAFYEKAAS